MTDAILTPFDLSEAVKTGRRRFWKRILPIGSINYKGQKIDFNDQFHTDLTESFRNEAFDQVPVVFADGENRHNMDPRNFGGDVIDLQKRKDGLYALIEADKDAAKAISRNPKLGVSARIVQGISKADGRSFKRAVNHVLLTMNPRVSGLGPWQAVDLSDEDADIEVVDLTASNYEEGSPMGKTLSKKKATGDEREIDLSSLTDEQFQQMLDLADTLLADPEADEEDDEEEVEETPAPKSAVRRKKSKTKITVEKDSEDEGDPEDDDEEDETDLSEVVDSDARTRVRQMEINLAEQRWESERGDYERAGVPPFLLDLAEPVLSQPEAVTIDLSDDNTIDASDTIRKMLDGVKGVLDFSDEIGTAIDLSEADKEGKDPASLLLKAWDEQYG